LKFRVQVSVSCENGTGLQVFYKFVEDTMMLGNVSEFSNLSISLINIPSVPQMRFKLAIL